MAIELTSSEVTAAENDVFLLPAASSVALDFFVTVHGPLGVRFIIRPQSGETINEVSGDKVCIGADEAIYLKTNGVNNYFTVIRPKNIKYGGTSADNAADARENLGITIDNIGPIELGDLPIGSAYQTLRTNSTASSTEYIDPIGDVSFLIDGGGAEITTGIKGDIRINLNAQILAVTLVADATGSIEVDIWKDTYANYPTDASDSITASATPTITSDIKSTDSTLTGWTTTITSGDILTFNVDSIDTIQRCLVNLKIKRT